MIAKTQLALREQIPSWGVTVLESHHAPGFFMEPREHPFLKIIYLLAGAGRIHVDAECFACQRGDVVVVPPHTTNQIKDDPHTPISLYACCIEPRILAFDPALLQEIPSGKLPPSSLLSEQAERLLRRIRFQLAIPANTQSVAIVALALDLVTAVIRSVPQGSQLTESERLERYLADLQTRFFEATTLEDAAREAGISRRRFTELFKQRTGMSWLPYVRQLGIEHARRLLADTDLAISSIAFECGFNDLSTFYRAFKKTVGTSPLKWRASWGQ